jgi:hypothetical protein
VSGEQAPSDKNEALQERYLESGDSNSCNSGCVCSGLHLAAAIIRIWSAVTGVLVSNYKSR